ncbi:MAG: MFS transporter [Chloroflexota bacterium]
MQQQKAAPTLYSWLVVAACFAVMGTLGETFWSFGVFFKPLENEFSWSRTVVSSSYTAFLLAYAVSVIAAGRLADRYNPRFILLAASGTTGFGIAFCSQIQSIGQLYFFLIIAGLGAGATWAVPITIVQRWFYGRQRAGLALSIVLAGVGTGALVFAPLINYLISRYGWRDAYLLVGISFFVIIFSAGLVVRRPPQEVPVAVPGEVIPSFTAAPGWPTAKAIFNPAYIGIVYAHVVVIIAFQIINVHLVPHATDVGIAPAVAAAGLGLLGGFSVPGRILAGVFSEKLGWQKIMAASIFAMALCVVLLIFLQTALTLYIFVFLYGLFHGARVPAYLGMLSESFGLRSLGEIIGIGTALAQVIASFGPYIAGFIFDNTGSYSIAFLIVMALLLSGGLVSVMIREPQTAPEEALQAL